VSGNQRSDGVGRTRALANPILQPIAIDLDLRRLASRIVVPEYLNEAPVSRIASFNHDNPEVRTLFRPHFPQPNCEHDSPSLSQLFVPVMFFVTLLVVVVPAT
jgi:hypothetical protein